MRPAAAGLSCLFRHSRNAAGNCAPFGALSFGALVLPTGGRIGQEIAHTSCARRPGGTRKARLWRAFQSVDKVNFFENTVFRASSAHEIDFATQNHKNREHGPGHPLLPLCGNSPCVSQFLYCFTFPRRAGCPHPAAAWELSDVRVLRVGRGDLTPPQTQIVGETVVSRQSKRAAPEGVALVVCGGRESVRKTPRGAALRKSGKTGATAICSGKCA